MAATETAFYDPVYGSSAGELAAAIRAEAFEEDTGQNSWLTASEHRAFIGWLGDFRAESDKSEAPSPGSRSSARGLRGDRGRLTTSTGLYRHRAENLEPLERDPAPTEARSQRSERSGTRREDK